MEELVGTALQQFPDVLGLIYYDDVLLASPHASRLEDGTKHLVNYLRDQGLRIADHKCALAPITQIDWIGKRFSHFTVSNNAARTRQIAGVIAGMANCRSLRLLRRLLGWISWYCSHFSGANRAMGPAYAALYQESEVLFLQALALVPDNEWAKQNLIILHRNRSLRA